MTGSRSQPSNEQYATTLEEVLALRSMCATLKDRNETLEARQISDLVEFAIMGTRATTAEARVAELENPFRAADDIDWAHLDQFIPQSGHGRFWKAVFAELRAALSHTGPVARDGER